MKLILYLSIVWHIFFFFFIHKLIELPGLLESWWTYKSLIYYKDFATFHFPLGRWILLPFYLLTNWNLLTGPILGLITNILIVIILHKFGKKHFSKAGTSVAIIFFSLFSWYLGTAIMFYHEMLAGLIFLVAFFNFATSQSSFKLGIIASLTELAGQIITPTLLIFSVLFAIKYPKKLWRYLLGALVPLTLLSLYFFTNNAFEEFFKQNFLYYTTYAKSYEKVSLLSLPLFELFLFYFPLISLIFFKKISFLFRFSVLLLLSTIPFVVFSVFHFHHLSFALPLASIVIGFLYSKKLASKITILFLVILAFRLLPWYINTSSFKNIGRIANNLTVGDTMYQTVDWVKKNTPDSSTILVAGDALFYFSTNRLPSNKNAYVSPYNWEPLKITIQEVNQDLPDYWVINRTYLTRLIKEYKKDLMVTYIEKTLTNSYSQKATFDDWEVWEKQNN